MYGKALYPMPTNHPRYCLLPELELKKPESNPVCQSLQEKYHHAELSLVAWPNELAFFGRA
jgi:hypothetical protein